MRKNGIGAYKKTNVLTANPKKLVIMCYEAAIRNLKTAKESYLSRDYESKAKRMQRAQDIISELMYALDFEKGGEIAKNLESLYNYMLRRLLAVEAQRDINAIDEVAGMLEELRGAWQEAFFGGKQDISEPAAHLADNMNKQRTPAAYGT